MKNYKKLTVLSIILILGVAIIAYITGGYQEKETDTSILFFNGNIISVDNTTPRP